MELKYFLLRLRNKNTGTGVIRGTIKKLATAIGVSETEAIHRGLVDSARTHLPHCAPDDGPLTAAQHAAIGKVVKSAHGRAKVTASLFDRRAAD